MARTLLIVDDNALNRRLLKGTLGKDYDILEAADGVEALCVVRRQYQLLSAVLLDIQMPKMDGYEVLRQMRESPVLSQIPVIMVTGTEDEKSRVKALDLGASDFITKPYSPDIIRHCLRNNIALRETAAIVNAIQRDKLTGLYNREFFFEKAGALIKSHAPGYYVLVCLDMDNFKLVNDQYGTAEGDRILKHIGVEMQKAIDREHGVCGRISGDNFVGLYPNRPDVDERIAQDRNTKYIPRDVLMSLHFSCGRCVVSDPSIPVSALYDRAYIAKQSIKGRFDTRTADFDDSMLVSLVREQQIVGQMDGALANREFEVWFQPQYDHSCGALIGAEALVRWRHPERGLIPPGLFIPVFEKNGFVYELDKYIWEETCKNLRKWLDEGRNPLPVSVNVSRYDLFRDDLVDGLTRLLKRYAIPVDLLRLEITESAFAESTRQIIAVVKRLIECGFTVEIDDFGSGYSSLNTLKDVPAQILKLDMRFLEGDDSSNRGGSILESIVRMAKWIGMTVLAEGVETKAQADYLKSVGCNYIQGYYYARPMPLADYEALAPKSIKKLELADFETVENFDKSSFWNPSSLDTMVFNHFSGGAFIFEYHAGRFEMLRVNDEFAKTFRSALSNDEILKLEPFATLEERDRKKIFDTAKRALQSTKAEICDVYSTRYCEPGRGEYVRLTVRRIAACGDRYLFYGYVDNITAQRMAEQKEHEITEQLQTIMDNINGGVVISVIKDGMADILFSNNRYYELFGYTKEEYDRVFAGSLGPICEEDGPRMLAEIEKVMRTGESGMFDFRAHRRDGAVIWLRDRVVRTTLGRHQQVQLSVLYDVTPHKEAEERLRQSEEELRIALSHSGTAICRFSIADRTLHISPDVAKRNALPESVADMPYGMLRLGKIYPESVKAYTDFFANILRGEKSGSIVYRFLLPGGWRWLEARYTTAFSDKGEPAFSVLSYYDVTERLEKEAVYRKWQQSMNEKSPSSYSLFRCNLNKNASYDMEEGALLHGAFDMENLSFNERAQNYAARRVFEEDRAQYLALVNSDVMLAAYYRGKRTETLEYREALTHGIRWLRLTIELVEQPNSSDVEAYLLYEDIDEMKKSELQIQQRAQTDSLTGLYNRNTFVEKFDKLLGAQKPGTLSALFIIDLDGFKQVNDNFGHAIGDETLIEMGQKLRGAFRGQDLVCRLGGDEFMITMCGVSHVSAVTERASLICALLHKSFSIEVQLSASIGISVCPGDGDDFESLYRKADLALYHVKRMGKDGYALYAPDMREKTFGPETEVEETSSAAAPHAAPKRRMLIVEDNEINRDFLTNLFEGEFIIDTAAEGTAALIKLRRYGSGISVVLLDLMMPGLDGFAVLQKMRESLTMQSIPVIVVSGMNERDTCLQAIREGASDYITKPVDADLLKLRVKSAISKAENEQLRAQNRYLAIQNEEVKRLVEAKRHSEELSVALHAAERADLAKSQFLSSMSHEIRTPLNAVIGYNTIARSEMSGAQTDEERRHASMKVMDCLTKSEVASRHLLTIINDVLDMSAIESGKMKVDETAFDFRSLITSLTVMFFSQARSKGVNFEVFFDRPTEEWFIGDQMRINQILTNLLSNAVKFTPEGGSVTLTITERTLDDTSAAFCFIVSDTGIGMTQEYLRHIWTPFEQAEASISRRFGGTGLGLSITKNLVDLMNGAIAVESESGVGSKFTVNLTLGRMAQPRKPASYDFSNVNALVVDDDVSTCDYIKLLFDRCGASCMALTSGREAISAFASAKERGKPFNVCLIDWRMPQMDGFATISEIRRIAAKNLPIVVVTAYDFTEVAEQAEKLGISKFVSKPLFQSSLFDLLATVSGNPPAMSTEKQPKYDFGGARVLLAEDNNMNMEVARRILLSAKVAVDSAWNGQEAVDIFLASKEGTYKAILMDIHMPGMDGYQATRLIRASKHPDAQRIPIIAMTADVFAEDIAQAHSAGMDDHIAKPIDVDSLFKMLSSHMEGREA